MEDKVIHIGGNEYVNAENVLVILDYRQAIQNADTGLFLRSFGSGAEWITVGDGSVRSAVLTYEKTGRKIYLSPVMPYTLAKRTKF